MPKPPQADEVVLAQQQWEYTARHMFVCCNNGSHPDNVIALLTEMGDDNWELVQVLPDNSFRVDAGTGVTFIFKRPKEEP